MTDRVMNPELVLIIILLILIAIVWGLIASVSKWQKGAYLRDIRAKDAAIREKEAHDPWAFVSPTLRENPENKWRLLIPQYEAQGHCMKAYRKKLGMPPGPDC